MCFFCPLYWTFKLLSLLPIINNTAIYIFVGNKKQIMFLFHPLRMLSLISRVWKNRDGALGWTGTKDAFLPTVNNTAIYFLVGNI